MATGARGHRRRDGALGVAALIRGVGDVIDNSGSILSWFSPIAWAQQMRPFVALRCWPFALLVLLAVALIALAAVAEARRQYDDGTIPATVTGPTRRRSPGSSVCICGCTGGRRSRGAPDCSWQDWLSGR